MGMEDPKRVRVSDRVEFDTTKNPYIKRKSRKFRIKNGIVRSSATGSMPYAYFKWFEDIFNRFRAEWVWDEECPLLHPDIFKYYRTKEFWNRESIKFDKYYLRFESPANSSAYNPKYRIYKKGQIVYSISRHKVETRKIIYREIDDLLQNVSVWLDFLDIKEED